MKACELSIGDWVKVLNYRWDGMPYIGQVGGIMKKHGTYYLRFGDALSAEIDVCEPIQITTDILEKNGFYYGYTSNEEDLASSTIAQLSEDDKGWCFDEGDGAIKVIFPNETDGGLLVLDDQSFDRHFEMVFSETIFLHEFQHVLRLCGIGKEIVL